MKHIIDCDATPISMRNPDRNVASSTNAVMEHIRYGQTEWSLERVAILSFQHKPESWGGSIPLCEMRERGEHFCNANVLDYLLEHQELIPEEWKNKHILFLGTTYDDSISGYSSRRDCWGHVRYLHFMCGFGKDGLGVWSWGWKNLKYSGRGSFEALIHK